MDTFQHSTPNKSTKGRASQDITLAVIHYTGSENEQSAIDWFESSEGKVSAHYVIARNGDIHQFETIYAKLWHAGDSVWRGKKWCNGCSIGYELCGTFDSGFTEEQYDSLCTLLIRDVEATRIDSIVGHEHIAPGRKIDPGPNFDWDRVRDWFTDNKQVIFIEGKPFTSKPEEVIEPKEIFIDDSGIFTKEIPAEINSGIDPQEEKQEKREEGFVGRLILWLLELLK